MSPKTTRAPKPKPATYFEKVPLEVVKAIVEGLPKNGKTRPGHRTVPHR